MKDKDKITFRQLAKQVNSDPSTLGAIARNTANPPASRLIALANFFDCSVDY